MKKLYVFLFTIFMFIISCNKPATSPTNSSEVIDGITYYDPSTAETKRYSFGRFDHNTGKLNYTANMFKKLAISENAILYLEEGHNVEKNSIISFLSQFEQYYDKEVEIYGKPSDLDQNGKIIFLMFAINTNEKPDDAKMGGYFNGTDLVSGKDGVKGEYLHVDIDTSDLNYILGVMMHELQHLINYNVNYIEGGQREMDVWLNEALSESTSLIFSEPLIGEREDIFNTSTYYSFYTWKLLYTDNTPEGTVSVGGDDNIFISYASSLMFMRWIDLKTGGKQEIYKEIAHSDPSLTDEERLMSVLSKYNLGMI